MSMFSFLKGIFTPMSNVTDAVGDFVNEQIVQQISLPFVGKVFNIQDDAKAEGLANAVVGANNVFRDVVDTVTGGSITNAEVADKNLADANARIDYLEGEIALTKKNKAIDWNQTLRSAALSARNSAIQAKQVNAQSEAGAVDIFQKESAAIAASGASGITEGTPYMSMRSSLNTARNQLREWFSQAKTGMEMSGEQTAMGLERARLGQESADLNLRGMGLNLEQGRRDIPMLERQASPLNKALDVMGGLMNTAVSVYTLGTNIGAGMMMFQNAGKTGMPSLEDVFKIGSAYKYYGMMGDSAGFGNFMSGMQKKNKFVMPNYDTLNDHLKYDVPYGWYTPGAY